ncbi:MAG: long-chain fatty acid--CoA ligase [bacterium]
MKYENLLELLEKNYKKNPTKGALYHKEGTTYTRLTYKELREKVKNLADSLKKLNLKEKDSVALLANNRPEWVISDLAILSIGCSVVPIYPTLSNKEILYILKHSQSKCIITELKNHKSLSKDIISYSKEIIIIALDQEKEGKTKSFNQLIEGKNKTTYENDIKKLNRETIASIVYTSGTTGPPKGVQLSHGNFLSNIESIVKRLPLTNNERVLSFLPLSHVFERTAGYYTLLALGGEIYYAENIESISKNMLECSPTVMISVPRLYEKMQNKILNNLPPIKKRIFNWSLNIGKKIRHKKKKKLIDTICLAIANKLVYSKIKKKTGGALKFFVSGGAPLNKTLAEFFYGLGILIIEGYGLTESSPVISCNHPKAFKFGTVGKALDCSKIKLSEENELCVKGPHIMRGYLNLKENTIVKIDKDGWLHTGDIAEIDKEGYIKIIDRKKDIIILSTGKNIAPQVIEEAIKTSPYISQIVIIGNKKPYLTALVVIDKENIIKFAIENKISYDLYEDLIQKEEIIKKIENEISEKQKRDSNYKKIKKFAIIKGEFTQENGELTPTLKPKRKIITDKNKKQIEYLYNEKR